jgi:monomeric isocitrate dehydrogenase
MSAPKHPETITAYPDSLTTLANEIGDLRYDALAEFLMTLSQKLESDGKKDGARGRKQLAHCLQASSEAIKHATEEIQTAWHICEPYMHEKS